VRTSVESQNQDKERLLWALDSGASGHFVSNPLGMTNVEHVKVQVRIANGSLNTSSVQGDLECEDLRTGSRFALTKVHVQEVFDKNLISLHKLLHNGCTIEDATTKNIILQHPGLHDAQDIILCFVRDFHDDLYYMEMRIIPTNDANDTEQRAEERALNASASQSTSIDINVAHCLLGHPGENKLCMTAKAFSWRLTGVLKFCDACEQAKARKKNTAKTTNEKATKPGERLCVDLSNRLQAGAGLQ
jgi:hypothetical protein